MIDRAWPGVSHNDVVTLLSQLVSIDSVNPSLVVDAPGEGEIAEFVARWLRDAGLTVDVQEVEPARPNVMGRVPGNGGGRTLILNAHLDTVGVGGMERPFEPRVEGDRLYGRGSYDMKGGLAAIMLAAREVARSGGTGGDVVVTAVMDEEYASLGTQAVVSSVEAQGAIVTEPTGLRLCTAHKGFAWLSVTTMGRAAHGSRPDLGVDAIAHMGRVLGSIEELVASLAAGPGHALLGTGSVHASRIEGGQELSTYPAWCRLDIERRTVPGESAEAILQEMRDRLDLLASQDQDFSGAVQLSLWREPFEVAETEPIVEEVAASATRILGSRPQVQGATPWMDAAILSSAGIPTVVFGPGGSGAHASIEYSTISEVASCANIVAGAAREFCAEWEDALPLSR